MDRKIIKERKIVLGLYLLAVADIEKAASEYLGETVCISEIECVFNYWKPVESAEILANCFDLTFGDEYFDAFDLFYDEEAEEYRLDGKRLALDEPGLPVEEIFDFDVSVFKSFNIEIDSSD